MTELLVTERGQEETITDLRWVIWDNEMSGGASNWCEKEAQCVTTWAMETWNWHLNTEHTYTAFPPISTVEVSQWPGIVDFRHVCTWCGQESSVSNHQLRDQWSHYQGVTGSQAAPGGQVLVWLQSGESGPGVSALVTSDNVETRGTGGWSHRKQETLVSPLSALRAHSYI